MLAGGIEADLTVTRLAAERFLVVTAAFTQTHVEAWIRNHIPEDAFCTVTDVSDAYAMLNVQGPASRALLQAVSTDDFSTTGFPFATCREMRIGYQTALALRLTYVGELGWELYIPTSFAQPVYDALDRRRQGAWAAALRLPRAELAADREGLPRLAARHRPGGFALEAGLAFTCDWSKPGGFIGREALLAQRAAGLPRRRLVQFLLEDPEPLLYHNEPIYRDGERVGFVTSAMYGHTLGAAVALGYVANPEGCSEEYIHAGRYEIEIAGGRVAARASLAPLYDPKSLRVRA